MKTNEQLKRFLDFSTIDNDRIVILFEDIIDRLPPLPEPVRPCTCHPDDNPPRPCPQKFALSECRKSAEPAPAPEPDFRAEAKGLLQNLRNLYSNSTEVDRLAEDLRRIYQQGIEAGRSSK